MIDESKLKACPFCGSVVDYMPLFSGVKMFYCRNHEGCGAVVSFDCSACNPGSRIRDAANAYHWNERKPEWFVEEKTGTWIADESRTGYGRYVCSECGEPYEVGMVCGKPAWNYCPGCGAKMEVTA